AAGLDLVGAANALVHAGRPPRPHAIGAGAILSAAIATPLGVRPDAVLSIANAPGALRRARLCAAVAAGLDLVEAANALVHAGRPPRPHAIGAGAILSAAIATPLGVRPDAVLSIANAPGALPRARLCAAFAAGLDLVEAANALVHAG